MVSIASSSIACPLPGRRVSRRRAKNAPATITNMIPQVTTTGSVIDGSGAKDDRRLQRRSHLSPRAHNLDRGETSGKESRQHPQHPDTEEDSGHSKDRDCKRQSPDRHQNRNQRGFSRDNQIDVAAQQREMDAAGEQTTEQKNRYFDGFFHLSFCSSITRCQASQHPSAKPAVSSAPLQNTPVAKVRSSQTPAAIPASVGITISQPSEPISARFLPIGRSPSRSNRARRWPRKRA